MRINRREFLKVTYYAILGVGGMGIGALALNKSSKHEKEFAGPPGQCTA